MQVGDLAVYNHAPRDHSNYLHRIKLGMPVDQVGIVLFNNIEGGTLKILTADKGIKWFVTSCCEVVSENR
jgi:hypothetical protein